MNDSTRFSDNAFEQNYQILKGRLEECFRKVKHTQDLRQAKALLIEVQSLFKGIALHKEDREELYGKLQQEFKKINDKQEAERLDFENEAAQTYLKIKPMLENAEYMVKHSHNHNETFAFLIEVQSQFKGAKLLKEHRENMYSRLQQAFEVLKQKQSDEKQKINENSETQLYRYKTIIQDLSSRAEKKEAENYETRDALVKLQAEIRDAELNREHREILYTNIREVFTIIDIRKEEEQQKIISDSERNYDDLLPIIKEWLLKSENLNDLKTIREKLKDLQQKVKDASLLRDQRGELYELIQKAFDILNERTDAEKGYFQRDARENYQKLKPLVEKGLHQAETTHEYKDTREFLKKIQSEFKGIRMIKEEREELYARLQLAFEILNRRVDDYYHNKKKNWEVRMNYKLSEFQTEILNLKDSIEKDNEVLNELEDQLDIMISSGRENLVKAGLEARIASVKLNIQKKQQRIEETENEYYSLKSKFESEDTNNL